MKSLIYVPLTVISQLVSIFCFAYLGLVQKRTKMRKLKFCIFMEENIFSLVCMSPAHWKPDWLSYGYLMDISAPFLHY